MKQFLDSISINGTVTALGFVGIPVVGIVNPLMDGTATIGASGKWADNAHVHPSDTSREPALGNPGTSGYVLSSTTGGVRSWIAASGFNPAAPGPIGGTTPSSGAFTTLSASGTFSASNFSGSHSGTSSGTNTGDQTNISGSSGSCTGSAATVSSLSGHNISELSNNSGYITSSGTSAACSGNAATSSSCSGTAASANILTTAGLSNTTPLPDSLSGSVGISTRAARADHVHPVYTSCFPDGCLVLMADRTWKEIQEVKPGEQVLGIDLQPNLVLEALHPLLNERFLVNFEDGSLPTSAEHTIWSRVGGREWFSSRDTKELAAEAVYGFGADLAVPAFNNDAWAPMEYAHLDGFKKMVTVLVESTPSVQLHQLLCDRSRTYIVNGYVVGSVPDDRTFDYSTIRWEEVAKCF